MKEFNMAANEIGTANLYDLQLFNDEEFVEESPTEDIAIESEVIENTEESTEESSNQNQLQTDGVANPEVIEKEDITQTQAFSRRLNEEREKIRREAETQAIDRYIAQQYEGQEWNGKPITTKAELDQALYEQQLINAGQDPETVQRLINEHPDVQRARAEVQRIQQEQQSYNEWLELIEEHKDIKDLSQVPQEVFEIANSKRIPLLDAYNRVHIKKVKLQTEQETLRNINKNATSSPSSASSGGTVHKTKSVNEMSAEEFEAYRDEVSKQHRGD